MLTKIEQVREANGESDARKAFDMLPDEEAFEYVKRQKHAELIRAQKDARHVIGFIEGYRLRHSAKDARTLWQKPALFELAKKYSIHSTMQEYFVDLVHEYFQARVQFALDYKAGKLGL